MEMPQTLLGPPKSQVSVVVGVHFETRIFLNQKSAEFMKSAEAMFFAYEPLVAFGEARLRADLRVPAHIIRPRLLLGSADALGMLDAYGVTHVVNCLTPDMASQRLTPLSQFPPSPAVNSPSPSFSLSKGHPPHHPHPS